MSSAERQGLLDAILAGPDDTTPRLVFADWLDDHGDAADRERAEFIRGQIRLAEMNAWDEGAVELAIRCRFLLRAHRNEWLAPLTDVPTESWFWDDRHIFARGFPERLEMAPAAFMEHADRIFSLTPLRGLAARQPMNFPFPADFGWCAGARRLRQLWLPRSNAPSVDLESALVAAGWSVENLAISSDMLRRPAEALVAASFAPTLRRLEIDSRHDDPNVWQPLWQSDRLRSLKRFGFRTRLNWAGTLRVPELLSAPWFSGLERLELSGMGGSSVLNIPDLTGFLRGNRLRGLELDCCHVSEGAVPALRGLPPVPLEHLDLGTGCEINKRALRALLQSPGLLGLRSLGLAGNGNLALTYLTQSRIRESLRVLRLSACDLAWVLRLARAGCPQLSRLVICLHSQPQDPTQLQALVDAIFDSGSFPRLVSLNWDAWPQVSSEVVRLTANHPRAARLLEFGLTACTTEDLRILCESRFLEGLPAFRISPYSLQRLPGWDAQLASLKQRLGPRLDDSRRFSQDAD
jgi:uncharacterized protein (TIGR02996 family)